METTENPVDSSAAGDVPAGQIRRSVPRVWPALLLIVAFWTARLVLGRIELTMFERFGISMLIEAVILLSFLAWWLISRRTSWAERLGGLAAIIVIEVLGGLVSDKSLRGMMWVFLTVPAVLTAWGIWWALARKVRPLIRTGGLIAVVALVCGVYVLLRSDSLGGEQEMSLHFRWTPTAEQRFLARLSSEPASVAVPPSQSPTFVIGATDWPGFRGPGRDGIVHGLQIASDWNAHPPRTLWREPLGPGWSSPAMAGGRVFTQEQRGPDEVVVCRDASTGSELWVHADRVRFEESLSGAGPRATPTLTDGAVYSLGATGILNCLDPISGKVKWSQNIPAETGVKPPMWGFASSPLVEHGIAIVYAGGAKGLLAYHADSGDLAWSVTAGDQCYTSPQPATLGGVEQVLFLSDHGLQAIDPAEGKQLWELPLPVSGAPRAIQPHPISDSQVLVSSETDLGTALIDVAHDGSEWKPHQAWASRALKPSFNDFVVSDGHAYGFDGPVFCCTDLANGKRCWREGRYGHGQVVLLGVQKLLLVISEEGDVILLRAMPERSEEIGRFHAVSGKIWSHPAVAGNRLVVRSDQEIACFELPPAP